MFSVPASSTSEELLKEMLQIVKRLEEGSFFSWLLKPRFADLCKASSNYLFTTEQHSIYTNLVNRYKIVTAGDSIYRDDNLLDKPLISHL